MGFSRHKYWSGLPCPPPGDLPDLGVELASLAGRFFYPWEEPLALFPSTTWEAPLLGDRNKEMSLGRQKASEGAHIPALQGSNTLPLALPSLNPNFAGLPRSYNCFLVLIDKHLLPQTVGQLSLQGPRGHTG